MKSTSLVTAAIFSVAILALVGCQPGPDADTASAQDSPAATDFERGPHRGRLLRHGDLELELQIFEDGVPPEYHVYLFSGGKALPVDAAQVSVRLTRLDGEVNDFTFAPQGDYLRGDGVVKEPHSFSVVVEAQREGQTHRWTFDSFEGRTTIPAASAEAAGVRVEAAGPVSLIDNLVLAGRLVPNAERTRQVSARFPGPIRTVHHSVGDLVKAGARLASVESNESLQTYAVTAPIDGIIIERNANPGETAGVEPLFVVADYRSLWAELAVFPRELPRLKAGQRVRLRATDGDAEGEGRVVRVVPVAAAGANASGLYSARVAIDNSDGRWVPGLFVQGSVQVGESTVPLAVKRSGLQAFRDFTVVFEQVGETYEVRMLELGRQDETWVEVLGGLKPGARYVAENSYLIKADVEKSGASHDH